MSLPLSSLRAAFGERLQENVPLAGLTTARVGGPADALVEVHSAAELAETVQQLWDLQMPYQILGGGSNILISDSGLRSLVVLNRARAVKFEMGQDTPSVWVESGANFSKLARQASLRGLSGLEWAASVPGTVGGAVFGNAGAFGSDVAHDLLLAEILHPESGRESWPVERLEYQYRSSCLKREKSLAVILAAQFRLKPGDPSAIRAQMEANSALRRQTQPGGATLGSMFKNPPGDYAGRLIEASGLKGYQIGDAEISTVHANFFINRGQARAADIWGLIQLARQTVADRHGVWLELEIELLGDFENFSQS